MTISMTGFASRKGQGEGYTWAWDIRSVNGKGLELRLRVPDWIDGLEATLRADLQKAFGRGNINLTLKVARDDAAGPVQRVNQAALSAALEALRSIEEAAMASGVTLGQPTAADVLALRGVYETGAQDDDTLPVRGAILADLLPLLDDFHAMRAAEGKALQAVISAQLDKIEALTSDALTEALARKDTARATLTEALARVLSNADGVDETRVAQELAMIAVKNDVTEELDPMIAE